MKNRIIFRPIIRTAKNIASALPFRLVRRRNNWRTPTEAPVEFSTPAALAPPPHATTETDERRVYSMVILYQNMAAEKRGYHFGKILTRQLGESMLWTTDSWRLDHLGHSDLSREAMEAAALADVVILAFDGKTDLSDVHKIWIEKWGARLFGWNPILIALFSAPDEKHAVNQSTLAFLATIAEACELTFLHTSGNSSIVEYRPEPPRVPELAYWC